MRYSVGVVLHPTRDVQAASATFEEWAAGREVDLVARPSDSVRMGGSARPVSESALAAECDAIVALGGDGTMLGALRLVAERPVPVLGVNLGSVGFLNEVEPAELPTALSMIVAGDYSVEAHAAVRVSSADHEWVAFNDAALVRVPGEGVLTAMLSVNGERHGRFRCDAIIVATPSGSTAYSYAAGGPVVSPGLAGMLLTPATPMSGISRSMVLSDREHLTLDLDVDCGSPALEIDGRVVEHLRPGSRVTTRLQLGAGQVIRLDGPRYRARSQVKLSLLDLPFLPDELRALGPRAPRDVEGEAGDTPHA